MLLGHFCSDKLPRHFTHIRTDARTDIPHTHMHARTRLTPLEGDSNCSYSRLCHFGWKLCQFGRNICTATSHCLEENSDHHIVICEAHVDSKVIIVHRQIMTTKVMGQKGPVIFATDLKKIKWEDHTHVP